MQIGEPPIKEPSEDRDSEYGVALADTDPAPEEEVVAYPAASSTTTTATTRTATAAAAAATPAATVRGHFVAPGRNRDVVKRGCPSRLLRGRSRGMGTGKSPRGLGLTADAPSLRWGKGDRGEPSGAPLPAREHTLGCEAVRTSGSSACDAQC